MLVLLLLVPLVFHLCSTAFALSSQLLAHALSVLLVCRCCGIRCSHLGSFFCNLCANDSERQLVFPLSMFLVCKILSHATKSPLVCAKDKGKFLLQLPLEILLMVHPNANALVRKPAEGLAVLVCADDGQVA